MTKLDHAKFEKQFRAATVEASSVDVKSREFDVIFTTGAPVERYSYRLGERYVEKLVVSEQAIDLGRLNNGAPLLNSHASYRLENVLGVVIPDSARVEGDKGICRVRFPAEGIDADADKIFAKVAGGIIRNTSVGYRYLEVTEITEPDKLTELRVDRWEPLEVSLVAIGADDSAKVRSKGDPDHEEFDVVINRSTRGADVSKKNENEVPDPNAETRAEGKKVNIDAELEDARSAVRKTATDDFSSMVDLALISKRSLDDVRGWISAGKSIDEVRAEIVDGDAQRSDETSQNSSHTLAQGSDDGASLERSMMEELKEKGLANA